MALSSVYGASAGLSCVCLILSSIALFLPYWGYFDESQNSYGFADHGHFGPWTVCKELNFDREKCGSDDNISRFRPSNLVYVSGAAIAISAISLGIYFILCVMQLVSKGSVMRTSSGGVKLVLSVIAVLTTVTSAGIFAIRTHDPRKGFRVTMAWSFYLVLVNIATTVCLIILSFYEYTEMKKGRAPREEEPRVAAKLQNEPVKRKRPFVPSFQPAASEEQHSFV